MGDAKIKLTTPAKSECFNKSCFVIEGILLHQELGKNSEQYYSDTQGQLRQRQFGHEISGSRVLANKITCFLITEEIHHLISLGDF